MQNELFSVLDEVDSTNNYAMRQIKQGFGINGKTWFAHNQTNGKGQRSKHWVSNKGENIMMSIIFKPNDVIMSNLYLFNTTVSQICHSFLATFIKNDLLIKWPNDLYIGDKKAGGILIENVFRGTAWEWAVIGIGINVNQVQFSNENIQAVSIKNITNCTYNLEELAQKLHKQLLNHLNNLNKINYLGSLDYLNKFLYKKDEHVLVEANNNTFYTKIIGVNQQGELITKTQTVFEQYKVGEIVFVQK
jgi:BirA family transcriptional regulator, biotin operon repressor / biotin---[acetyl-CoA-carboxylase] ligase